jgi:hypothetical protein
LQYGVDFLADDFREYGGYARSVELSRMYGLYRQTYCGCGFARDAGVSNAKTSDVKTRGGGAGCGDAGRDTEEPSPCAPEVFGGRARKMRM